MLRFIEWPADLLRPQHPVIVGLAGSCRSHASFLSLEADSAQGRPIRVETVENGAGAARCHALVVCEDAPWLLLDELASASVLTISALPGFAARGGMLELQGGGESLRFILNEEAVARSPLVISAQLRKLALQRPVNEASPR